MAASKGIRDVDDLALRMMLETVTALRMFVNDEVNELQFAISAVAENMLRPGKQTIFCSSFGTPCTIDIIVQTTCTIYLIRLRAAKHLILMASVRWQATRGAAHEARVEGGGGVPLGAEVA